jgi:hypothetical protein
MISTRSAPSLGGDRLATLGTEVYPGRSANPVMRYDCWPMANQEHLDILAKGVNEWNAWRSDHPEEIPDLSNANLRSSNLSGANLKNATLSRVDASGAKLTSIGLRDADLSRGSFVDADMRMATLRSATLTGARLLGCDLSGADLKLANLSYTDLSGAYLRGTRLTGTTVTGTRLRGTTFVDVDLSSIIDLTTVEHRGPSSIGIDTIYRSGGNIPESFLRSAGVPENFIAYVKSLAGTPLDFYSCFISYSGRDQQFAERMHADLQAKGVRVWFAPEDLKIGDKFSSRIDESIRVHDKLLLVLSEHSIRSPWVGKEVEAAFEREHRENCTVLFPIRLDDAVMETDEAWAADIRRTRHIGDFRQWQQQANYANGFGRLLRDLKSIPDDVVAGRQG